MDCCITNLFMLVCYTRILKIECNLMNRMELLDASLELETISTCYSILIGSFYSHLRIMHPLLPEKILENILSIIY